MKKKNLLNGLSWKIIESYFKEKYLTRLVRHQIESYNYFVEHQIEETIKMFNPVRIVSSKDVNDKGIYSLEILINFKSD